MSYRFSDGYVEQVATDLKFNTELATEKDLLNAKAMAPAEAGSIDILLLTLREGEPPEKPLRIEITNMDALKSDKVLRLKRDEDTGKVVGATVMNVSSARKNRREPSRKSTCAMCLD